MSSLKLIPSLTFPPTTDNSIPPPRFNDPADVDRGAHAFADAGDATDAAVVVAAPNPKSVFEFALEYSVRILVTSDAFFGSRNTLFPAALIRCNRLDDSHREKRRSR